MALADRLIKSGNAQLRIEGLRETLKALEAAGSSAEEMRDLMHSLGTIVVHRAKGAAPVGATGNLRDSIRAGRGKTKAVVRAGYARVPYAGVVHYGWPARNITPNPYLVRPYLETRGEVLAALARGIDELLKKEKLK